MDAAQTIRHALVSALGRLGVSMPQPALEFPAELAHGDFATNAALAYGKQLGKNPRACADEIRAELGAIEGVAKIEIAGPGFINFHLAPDYIAKKMRAVLDDPTQWGGNSEYAGKKLLIEHSSPNLFKPFHIGHLMTNAIGESLARVLEHSGAEVRRANYQGDVGLHVAKAIYGLLNNPDWRERKVSHNEEAENIGKAYVYGSNAYEKDPRAKREIDAINKKVYARDDEEINGIYDWGFKATMEAFEDLYKILGTKFDFYFL